MNGIYEIKQNGKWEKVLAENIQAVLAYNKENNLQDCRFGMMYSRAETKIIHATARTI